MSDINQSESQIEEEINNSNMDVDWDPIVEQSIHPDLDLDDDIPDLEPAYDINLDIVPPNQNQNPYLDRIDDLNNDLDRIGLNNDNLNRINDLNLNRIYNQIVNTNFIPDQRNDNNDNNDNNQLWGVSYNNGNNQLSGVSYNNGNNQLWGVSYNNDNNQYYVHQLLPQ